MIRKNKKKRNIFANQQHPHRKLLINESTRGFTIKETRQKQPKIAKKQKPKIANFESPERRKSSRRRKRPLERRLQRRNTPQKSQIVKKEVLQMIKKVKQISMQEPYNPHLLNQSIPNNALNITKQSLGEFRISCLSEKSTKKNLPNSKLRQLRAGVKLKGIRLRMKMKRPDLSPPERSRSPQNSKNPKNAKIYSMTQESSVHMIKKTSKLNFTRKASNQLAKFGIPRLQFKYLERSINRLREEEERLKGAEKRRRLQKRPQKGNLIAEDLRISNCSLKTDQAKNPKNQDLGGLNSLSALHSINGSPGRTIKALKVSRNRIREGGAQKDILKDLDKMKALNEIHEHISRNKRMRVMLYQDLSKEKAKNSKQKRVNSQIKQLNNKNYKKKIGEMIKQKSREIRTLEEIRRLTDPRNMLKVKSLLTNVDYNPKASKKRSQEEIKLARAKPFIKMGYSLENRLNSAVEPNLRNSIEKISLGSRQSWRSLEQPSGGFKSQAMRPMKPDRPPTTHSISLEEAGAWTMPKPLVECFCEPEPKPGVSSFSGLDCDRIFVGRLFCGVKTDENGSQKGFLFEEELRDVRNLRLTYQQKRMLLMQEDGGRVEEEAVYELTGGGGYFGSACVGGKVNGRGGGGGGQGRKGGDGLPGSSSVCSFSDGSGERRDVVLRKVGFERYPIEKIKEDLDLFERIYQQ